MHDAPPQDPRTISMQPVKTLAMVLKVEPRIGKILEQASCEPSPSQDTYQAYCQQIETLVGWHAQNPQLATEEAYLLVEAAIVKALGV